MKGSMLVTRLQGRGWLIGRFGNKEVKGFVLLTSRHVGERSEGQTWTALEQGREKVKGRVWKKWAGKQK